MYHRSKLSLNCMSCLIGAASVVLPVTSQAAVLLEESFDYEAGSLAGQAGGQGFAAGSAWSVSVSSDAVGGAVVNAGSLAFSDYATSGNHLTITLDSITGTGARTVLAERGVGFSATGGDVWVTMLYQRNDALTNGSRTAEVRIDGSAGSQFGVQPKKSGSQNGTIRYDGSTGGQSGALQNGDVRMLVARFADVGSTGAAATLWSFNESYYDTIKADGITIAELDASGTAVTDTLASDDSRTISSGDALKLLANSSQAPFSFNLDELRYGTTLESALAPVPEPSSIGIIAAGAALLLGRRRQNQAD